MTADRFSRLLSHACVQIGERTFVPAGCPQTAARRAIGGIR